MEEKLLHEFLTLHAKEFAEKIAIDDGVNPITYHQLDMVSSSFAAYLAKLGVKRGDRVAIFSAKTIASIVAIFGILKAGAVFIPLNTNMVAESIMFILNDCGCTVLVADENAKKLSGAFKRLTNLKTVVDLTNGNQNFEDIESIRIYDAVSGQPADYRREDIIENDLAYIIFTSGSTGVPKGVMITHYSICFVVKFRGKAMHITESTNLLSVSPLYFDPVLNEIFCTLRVGGCIYLLDDTYRQVSKRSKAFLLRFLNIVQKKRITTLFCVPSLLNLLATNTNILVDYDLSSFRYIAFGAGSCPVITIQTLQKSIPGVRFVHGYGLTETSVTACSYCIENPYDVKYESFPLGKPMPQTEFYVLDENMSLVGEGKVGQLAIRGPHLMNGYWHNECETNKVLVNNPVFPWQNEKILLTGDLVRVETGGALVFVGRNDEQIKSAGYRIELGEIEMKICNSGFVKEACAIPFPDANIGFSIRCYLVLAGKKTLEDVKSYCSNALTSYCIPQSWVVVDGIPKNDSGKIDRKLLKSIAEDAV